MVGVWARSRLDSGAVLWNRDIPMERENAAMLAEETGVSILTTTHIGESASVASLGKVAWAL